MKKNPLYRPLYGGSLAVLAVVLLNTSAFGQTDSRYFMANQLFKQQKFEQAYSVFKELHDNAPGVYIYFERATESLINLKRYDQAIKLADKETANNNYPNQARIKLAEILYTKGDTTQAFSNWDKVLKANKKNFQLYLSVARSMREKRAFERSIAVYKQAAKLFPDSSVLSTELAQTYLQSGRYEASIKEYLQLIKRKPDRINYVQSVMLRFNDDNLYDIAILEIDDFLKGLPGNHPAKTGMLQLQIWLLLERNLYQRAYVTAKNYEQQHNQLTYTLYSLGDRLLSEQQFELAAKAYLYYINENLGAAKYASMEKLAAVYSRWADYQKRYHLGYTSSQDTLYAKAYDLLETLGKQAANYQHAERVLRRQAELALDYLHKPEQAAQLLEKLKQREPSAKPAEQYYIDGRIKLYGKNYDRARIAFTKSSKQEHIGSLAQKDRYYLALTDFYSGNYEFAKIQLNALERQNTSYYANDAVQLRLWIQQGLQADSSGHILEPLARAIELFSAGENEQAIKVLQPMAESKQPNPLTDDALILISTYAAQDDISSTFSLIHTYLQGNGRYSPLRERLLWEKARLGDRAQSFKTVQQTGANSITLPATAKQLISLYEDLLVEYPEGFYATHARERIKELQKPAS